MRYKRLSDEPVRVFVVVFEPGDEPVRELTGFAERESVDAASVTAVGGFERSVVGWFDLEKRDYRRIPVDEQTEVLTLDGDITCAEQKLGAPAGGDRKVHCHVVLGRRDGSTVGGHLLQAAVRPTLEVMVTETPAQLRRRHDPSTGLALIDPIDHAALASGGTAR